MFIYNAPLLLLMLRDIICRHACVAVAFQIFTYRPPCYFMASRCLHALFFRYDVDTPARRHAIDAAFADAFLR